MDRAAFARTIKQSWNLSVGVHPMADDHRLYAVKMVDAEHEDDAEFYFEAQGETVTAELRINNRVGLVPSQPAVDIGLSLEPQDLKTLDLASAAQRDGWRRLTV